MSLDLFARHVRNQMQVYEQKSNQIVNEVIVLEEPEVIKNPFLLLEDIFNDALPNIDSDKFYSVSFIGSQGKGKTFSASILATLAERKGFLVIYGKAEDFLEDKESWIEQIKEKIKEHDDIRVCFVLDDMSYSTAMVSSKKAAGFKHFVADIRHVLEPVLGDIKIFMIYISHRLHSLPPMLRNSGTWIFGSALPEDRADAIKLIPKNKDERERLEEIFRFLQKISNEGPKQGTIKYNLGERQYDFRWGKQDDPGDGRLMMVSHAGEMKILQSKKIDNMIDLEHQRILVKPKPSKEIEEMIIPVNEDEIRKQAEKLFPKPEDDIHDPFITLKHDMLPITKEYQDEKL